MNIYLFCVPIPKFFTIFSTLVVRAPKYNYIEPPLPISDVFVPADHEPDIRFVPPPFRLSKTLKNLLKNEKMKNGKAWRRISFIKRCAKILMVCCRCCHFASFSAALS